MMQLVVVPRNHIDRVWKTILPGVETYIVKTPHEVGTAEDVRQFLKSDDGDELAVFGDGANYVGFMTFKVQPFEKDLWGTIAMIYIVPGGNLEEAADLLAGRLRRRGCNIMNYMTARKGFHRLAPRLGFRPRIIEWMKEL